MPKAHSLDLRVRVLEAYRGGMSVAEVCFLFKVSRDCVYDWNKLEREKGSLKPQYENCTGRNSTIKPEYLRAWVDETGIDDNEFYAYGRSPKGERCLAVRPGKKSKRISIVAGLVGENLLAPCWFEGICNTDFFNEWLEKMLLPELPQNATVILDNASFHKSEKTRLIIEAAGCKVLFLPPYSPRDNKIEHEWFPIKNQIRKILQTFQNIYAAVEATLIIRS